MRVLLGLLGPDRQGSESSRVEELGGVWRRVNQSRGYLRIFRRKIALAAVRAQAVSLSNRLEQARAQNDGSPGPSKRARAQSWRAKKDHDEYMWAHASFASAQHRRG